MPSWLFPAALTGGISLLTGALAVIWAEIKASEVRQQEALKAMEARQREEMRETRADMKALGENVDRLMETMMTVRK
ncbi:MAG: hypothetical protein OXF25_11345 [Cyanobacteria bacterium MAG CAR3_bin_5]|nr:hypothetical protein [Cyanobacteria bacterium MAG CAR3_bin_5]